jgi:ubiquitin-protein ligase
MEEEPQRTAEDIRKKRIDQEMALVTKLDKDMYQINVKETSFGHQIMIRMARDVMEIETDLIDSNLKSFDFEILLPPKYPFLDPQIMCHTDFAHKFLSLNDGRDIFNEVVGDQGWRVGFKLYTLV